MFYVWLDRDADGDEAFYWRGKNEPDDPWCVPVGEVLSEDFSLLERLNAIKASEWFKPEHEEIVRRELSTLHEIGNYDVGVTEFETDDYALETEFSRVTSSLLSFEVLPFWRWSATRHSVSLSSWSSCVWE
jgi:hypothetical protein